MTLSTCTALNGRVFSRKLHIMLLFHDNDGDVKCSMTVHNVQIDGIQLQPTYRKMCVGNHQNEIKAANEWNTKKCYNSKPEFQVN